MQIIQVQKIMEEHPDHRRLPHAAVYEHGTAFSNDAYGSIDDATVPLTDLGFTQADGAYDVVSVSRGHFFRLDDHLDRFEESSARFLLRNPYSRGEVIDILQRLVALSGQRDAYVWFGLTRGQLVKDRICADAYQNRFHAFVSPYVFIADDDMRSRGMNLAVSRRYLRIPSEAVDPRAKNFHWMDLKLSLFEARERGGEWSALCDQHGYLTEAPGANIFILEGDALMTPDDGCLEGITRRTTFDLAAEMGLKTRVERVHVDRLHAADEAFLTSSAGGIMPVGTVDGKPLGAGADRRRTAAIHDLYWTKRWDGWLGTAVDYQAVTAA